MGARPKNVVIFRSLAFNTTQPRDYFINPCCFGDDLARWLIDELRRRGIAAEEEPGQEDFGWYLRYTVRDRDYTFVITFVPEEQNQGDWLGKVERNCGFWASLFGGRDRGIDPAAIRVSHEILEESDCITDILWRDAFVPDRDGKNSNSIEL